MVIMLPGDIREKYMQWVSGMMGHLKSP